MNPRFIVLKLQVCPFHRSSLSLSLKCALREGGCRISYEPTKMSRDHFWQSISRDINVEVSALSPFHRCEDLTEWA